MQFLMFVCTDPNAEPHIPAEDNIEEWVNEFDNNGMRLLGDRLADIEEAVLVTKRGGIVSTVALDSTSPQADIAGIDMLECTNIEEAIAVAAKHPMARFGKIVVRPFWKWE